jgi:hypothetical protein
MPRLELEDFLLGRDAYAAVRDQERNRILPLRRSRRLHVGENVTLEFENEATLHFQVQEMIYAEGVTRESAALEEIATYRRLLPTTTSLTATMFLEFPDPATVREDLDQLHGIQDRVSLQVGTSSFRAKDLPPPDEANSDQTYSVHFLQFDIDQAHRPALADLLSPASVRIDHPNYQVEVEIPAELRAQLLKDLSPPN